MGYKTHQTIRHTYVLEEENGKKYPTPLSQVSYIQTTRHTPIFVPNLGVGSACCSLKNTVTHLKFLRVSTHTAFFVAEVVKGVSLFSSTQVDLRKLFNFQEFVFYVQNFKTRLMK